MGKQGEKNARSATGLTKKIQKELLEIMVRIVPVHEKNYRDFEKMVRRRTSGRFAAACKDFEEREPSARILEELANPNLYVFAAAADGIFVGWISLAYLPKVGKFEGHGHIYVDELWVDPAYRRGGVAKMLMKQAEILAERKEAAGIRLYVNTENPGALSLYQLCGYKKNDTAYFMEK